MVIEELRQLIQIYLNSKENRTLQYLASKAGISYSTVRRVMQNEIKTVDLSNALAILQVVAETPEQLSFLDKHFPLAGQYISKVAKAKDIKKPISEEIERSLLDFEKFTIISLAATPSGTTESDVEMVLGQIGKKKVDELLESGVLTLKSGQLKTAEESFASANLNNQLTQVLHCLRYIRHENRGKKKQHVGVCTDGVSKEGQQKIHQIFEKAVLEAIHIASSAKGDIPIFYGAMMGTFLTERSN